MHVPTQMLTTCRMTINTDSWAETLMCTCDISHLQVTDNTNSLTLLTSVNEQLYVCTSMSTTSVWPLAAASITGVTDIFRKHSKRQDERYKEKCKENDVDITSAHKFIGFSAECQDQSGPTITLVTHTKSLPSLNEPVSIPPMFINIHHMSPSITQPTTGPTALYKTPACLTTHLGMRIGVQLVLIDDNPHQFSMAFLSCQVQHGETEVLSAVEQGLHFGREVLDSADMATLCSQVESIISVLQNRNA